MNNSKISYINNSEIEDNEEISKERLRELDEEHEQEIKNLYDKVEIIDYQSNIYDNDKANKAPKDKQESLKEVFSQKYVGHDYLADAVIVGFKPYFAVTSKPNDTNKFPSIVLLESITLDEKTILKPPGSISYLNKPYVFKSEEAFYQYIENAKQQQ